MLRSLPCISFMFRGSCAGREVSYAMSQGPTHTMSQSIFPRLKHPMLMIIFPFLFSLPRRCIAGLLSAHAMSHRLSIPQLPKRKFYYLVFDSISNSGGGVSRTTWMHTFFLKKCIHPGKWTDSVCSDEFDFHDRSPRPCPGVKCYRTCRGHAQALHVMYMLLRREDYFNVIVHECDSFLKDKRLTLPHAGSTHQTWREACHGHSKE